MIKFDQVQNPQNLNLINLLTKR